MTERNPPSVKLARTNAAGRPLMDMCRLNYVARHNALLRTLLSNGFQAEMSGSDKTIMNKLGYYLVVLANHNVVGGSNDPLSIRIAKWWVLRTEEGAVDYSDIVYDMFREAGAALE